MKMRAMVMCWLGKEDEVEKEGERRVANWFRTGIR